MCALETFFDLGDGLDLLWSRHMSSSYWLTHARPRFEIRLLSRRSSFGTRSSPDSEGKAPTKTGGSLLTKQPALAFPILMPSRAPAVLGRGMRLCGCDCNEGGPPLQGGGEPAASPLMTTSVPPSPTSAPLPRPPAGGTFPPAQPGGLIAEEDQRNTCRAEWRTSPKARCHLRQRITK